MFCPVCKDEFRAGFTRCAGCDADLVENLDAAAAEVVATAAPSPTGGAPEGLVRMADFCGFVELEEARDARELLRGHGIRADILIREMPGPDPAGPLAEEYWLRVDAARYREVAPLIGYHTVEDDSGSFGCSACGATVAASADRCPGCGLSFEES